ncbi:MAG: Rho termination factor N-terminal domain-containing protein, partial [Bacteroidales bacterium]|nr:Rho termination factor N-terminal domain-containing protein [Bacteroidales bacterium]
MYDIIELSGKLVSELKDIAKELNIPKYEKLLKQDLIYKILDQQALNPSQDILKKEKAETNTKRHGRNRNVKPKEAREEKSHIKTDKPYIKTDKPYVKADKPHVK